MKVTSALMSSATKMVANNARAIQESKKIQTIGCSYCGLGCSGIVGGD